MWLACLTTVAALAAQDPGPGLFVHSAGTDETRFVPWSSEVTITREIRRLRDGGTIRFAPGTYVIDEAIVVALANNLTISGSAAVTLEFAPGPERTPRTLSAVEAGDTTLHIDHPGDLIAGRRYQLYPPESDLNRVLEFIVESVEDGQVLLTKPVAFMPLIKEIPAGCRVIEEVNFFRVLGSPGTVIENFTLDGMGRGEIRGHTLFTGVYASGLLVGGGRPKVSGLTVRGCDFRRLTGRGVAAYGIADVLVEECSFTDIRAQAIEIDHYSQGLVRRNVVDGAEVGVMVNDAFETVVEHNVLSNCWTAVRLLRIFPEDWVNTGNIVRSNRIGPGCTRGVALDDDLSNGLIGNEITGNHFIGMERGVRVIGRRRNQVADNTSEN
jgi:hypothetical protein